MTAYKRTIPSRVATLIAVLLFPLTSAAQAPGGDAGAIEEIVVTGSRIKDAGLTAASPVTTISDGKLEASGVGTVENFLNRLPQVAPSENANSNRGQGIATVDLRALGPTRTLVLVNGRRFTPSNGVGVVDLNSIPSALIERVEVVTGGASAVYGSDALAGVVNFIMKKNFDGLQFRAQTGVSSQGDGEMTEGEATVGTHFADDRGNIALSLAFFDRERIGTADRDAFRLSINGGSATAPAGRIDSVGLNPNPLSDAFLGSAISTREYAFANDALGIKPFNNALPEANPDGDRYNFTARESLQIPLERVSMALLANYEVAPNTIGYIEGFYTDNRTTLRGGESPLTNARLSPTNPLLPQAARDMLAQRPDPTADAIFRRRLVEVGDRIERKDTDTYQLTMGLQGTVSDQFDWDVSFSSGRSEQLTTISGGASQSKIEASLLGCPEATVLLLGCRLVDFFGEDSLSAEDVEYIRIGEAKDTVVFERDNLTATLGGPLMRLPAGDLQFSVGAEYREDEFQSSPSDLKVTGDLAGFNFASPTSGSYDVFEVFGELHVPILADSFLGNRLDAQFGLRYSDYSSIGDVSTFKAGLSWQPLDDIRVRGIFQRAIRAPSVFELFQGGDLLATTFRDPCATILPDGSSAPPPTIEVAAICQLQGLPDPRTAAFTQVSRTLDVELVGNAALVEESSDSVSMGLVYQPSPFPGLDLSVDYFSIEIDDFINRSFGGISGAIDSCFSSGVTTQAEYDANPACTLLFRDASGEARALLPLANIQRLETKGFDFAARYTVDFNNLGNLLLSLNVTNTNDYEVDGVDFAGLVSQDFGSLPEWRSYADARWARGKATAALSWQRIGEMSEEIDDIKVDATNYLHLTGSYEISDVWRVYGGVNNFMDEDAPIIPNQVANTETSTYDIVGRYYFVGFRADFQ